jgi:hypothetical protein
MDNKTWDNMISWSDVLPPSRPDVWQLDIISEYLNNISCNAPIALLGTTIEFLDLLAFKEKVNIFVFEKNKKFYTSQLKYRAYNNSETVVWGDWLNTLCNYSNYFELILSDLTLGNISYPNQEPFYKYISESLTRNGIFIDRVLTHSFEHESLDKLLHKYEKLPINLRTINDFSCEFLFCSELLNESKEVNSSLFYNKIKSFTSNKKILKFLDFSPLVTPNNCIWWYGKSWVEIQKTYNAFFDLISTYDEPQDSVYYKRAKLFINKRK